MTVDDLDFDKGNGLLTVVTQHAVTGAVLMLAHMDREAFDKTVETGEMHYRSRTRGLWHKGATSGNTQRVVSLARDCDGDAILARVMPAGPACHEGTTSCFDQQPNGDALTGLAAVIDSRMHDSERGANAGHGYTQRLLADRNLRLKKLGEEAAELVLALADSDSVRAAEEGADVLYHMMVALRAQGVTLDDVRQVIANRADQPG